MSSIIKVLDENTANKIAAGEVVERPASIVKELVENSIDAGSTAIEVEIADGGTAYLRITDNGIGMSHEDAKLAVLRHATSKIRQVDDLECISSLGFRGEALPSIASVSRFELTTRLHEEALGTYLLIEGGQMLEVREAGANVGTTIVVKDLFFNTPARRKFLKTASAESSHIHNVMIKLSLSHPDISFKLLNNQRLVLSTPGNNNLKDTLSSLYGNKVAPELLPLEFHSESLTISGFIGKPTLLKSSRHWQTFMVNLRIINSRFISKALDNAYHSLLPKSGYPLAVLNIQVPLDRVDVNVHPQKSEIKFSDEQMVFRAVYHAVSEALTQPDKPDEIAAQPNEKFIEHKAEMLYMPSRTYQYQPMNFSQSSYEQASAVKAEPQVAFNEFRTQVTEERLMPLNHIAEDADGQEGFMLQPLGQIEDCFIVAKGPGGLYIIDQHAAHERVLYDRLCAATERIPVQQLLVPPYLEFDALETNLITAYTKTFYDLGFTLELIGPNTFRLAELPADIKEAEAEAIIKEILALMQDMQKPAAAELRHACLQIAACRTAIKAGEALNMRQIQTLIGDLCKTRLPYTCPHGRPAIIKFSPADLFKMFKRT
jgi:DNA mismatch repair protein MutL